MNRLNGGVRKLTVRNIELPVLLAGLHWFDNQYAQYIAVNAIKKPCIEIIFRRCRLGTLAEAGMYVGVSYAQQLKNKVDLKHELGIILNANRLLNYGKAEAVRFYFKYDYEECAHNVVKQYNALRNTDFEVANFYDDEIPSIEIIGRKFYYGDVFYLGFMLGLASTQEPALD